MQYDPIAGRWTGNGPQTPYVAGGSPPGSKNRPTPESTALAGTQAQAIDPQLLQMLMTAFARPVSIIALPFLAQVAAAQVRPQESRAYLLVQNQSAASNIALGIGNAPSATGIAPVNGLLMTPGSVYEPAAVPNNALWVIGGAPNVPCLFLYALLI